MICENACNWASLLLMFSAFVFGWCMGLLDWRVISNVVFSLVLYIIN